jgi:hypothetical protein
MSAPTATAVQPATPRAILELLAAAIRGEAPGWPAGDAPAPAELLRVATEQGLDVLVASRADTLATWPAGLRASFAARLRDACVVEAVREREIVRLLDGLRDAGVHPLLVKGTALAYSVYGSPHLRPRVDTDLLVAEAEAEGAMRALESLGYARSAQNVGQLVSHQVALARIDAHGVWHAVDVHWRLANPHVFANLLPFGELADAAVPLPALGPHARTPGDPHAVLVAALHLAAHHAHHVRLIWLYDLDLLCRRMSADALGEVAAMARERGLASVCARGLHLARRWFDTPVPAGVLAALDAVDARSEKPARYVAGSVGKLGTLISDLRTLPTWGARARLLYEHAFPPAEYMLRSYRTSRRSWLPALYLHRMVTGGWRWLRQA